MYFWAMLIRKLLTAEVFIGRSDSTWYHKPINFLGVDYLFGSILKIHSHTNELTSYYWQVKIYNIKSAIITIIKHIPQFLGFFPKFRFTLNVPVANSVYSNRFWSNLYFRIE